MNVLLLLASADAPHTPEVPTWVTVLFGSILALMILTLALEEKLHIKKSLITGTFAIVSLFLATIFHEHLGNILPFGPVTNVFGHEVDLPIYIPAVDWSVVAIILGSGLFVDVTSQSGLFTWIAIKLTKLSGGDPVKLLTVYGVMTVLFSAALNNVTAMIIVGSLTVVSLQKLERTDKLLGFLLIEGLLTNVGGLLTLISSVPNIIVGTTAGISFMKFFLVAAPYTVLATAATIFLGARLFKIHRLRKDEVAEAQQQVASFDERDGIKSVGAFRFSTGMFILFILAIATTSALPYASKLGLGFVVSAFAVVALLQYKSTVGRYYEAVNWDLLGFFVGLFVVINVMEHLQVLHAIGTALKPIIELGERTGSGTLLIAAAVASSVTDNIPLAAMLAKILHGMPSVTEDSALWWSVVFGGNLGGNLTPIGSASTIVAVTIMAKHELPASFGKFVVLAIPYAAVQLVLAVLYVMFVVPLFNG